MCLHVLWGAAHTHAGKDISEPGTVRCSRYITYAMPKKALCKAQGWLRSLKRRASPLIAGAMKASRKGCRTVERKKQEGLEEGARDKLCRLGMAWWLGYLLASSS